MFVPGNRERFIQKGNSSSADAVLLDIEDGVLPGEKAEARGMIAAALARSWRGPRRYVRVNARSTPWLEADLDAVVGRARRHLPHQSDPRGGHPRHGGVIDRLEASTAWRLESCVSSRRSRARAG